MAQQAIVPLRHAVDGGGDRLAPPSNHEPWSPVGKFSLKRRMLAARPPRPRL
jgi:hypothetical protein